MLYIGVDLGTSAVKLLLLLMDGAGKILNIVSRQYPMPGRGTTPPRR